MKNILNRKAKSFVSLFLVVFLIANGLSLQRFPVLAEEELFTDEGGIYGAGPGVGMTQVEGGSSEDNDIGPFHDISAEGDSREEEAGSIDGNESEGSSPYDEGTPQENPEEYDGSAPDQEVQGGIEGHDYPGGNAGETGSEEGKEDDIAAGAFGAFEDSGNHKGVSDEHKFAPYLSDNYDSFFDEESRILQIILYKDCEEDLVILDDLLWDHEGMVVIIDLNGYTLFAKGVHPAAITVFGSLTIQDSVGGGRIDGGGKKNIRGIKVGRHGSLRIEDGVTICNFNVRGNGGGILAEKGARVTLSGATITGNTASGNGGGLFSYAAESIEFQGPQNIISRNHAENGGGIAFSVMQAERDEDVPDFSYTLDNVSVFANKADENGGGIYFDGISDVCLEGSLAVSGNMAGKNGGGLYFRSQSSLARVRDGARIGGNTAKKGNGGGIHMTGLYSGLLMEGGIIGAVDAEAYDTGASEEDISGSYVDDAEAAELAAGRGNLAAAGSGGGVCLYWRNTLDVENGSIEGNQAAEQDDDVFLDTGNYSVYAGEGENDTGSLAGVLTAEGSDYTVNVWYRKEAEIPADAELVVEKLDEDRDEYADFLSMKEEEVAAQSDGEKKISSAAFFDLKILSDGEEILPAAPVEVWISYDGMMADGDTEELEVTDLSDEEGQGQVDFELREVQKGGGVAGNHFVGNSVSGIDFRFPGRSGLGG